MGLDDRTADRKSYSGPGGFCRKERFEDTVLVFSIYSCPGVFYGDKDSGGPLNDTGPYPQLPRTVGDRVHGFDRVHSQVQKNLLQLASIGQQGLESFA